MGLLDKINLSIGSSLIVPACACIAGGVVGGLTAKKVFETSAPIDLLPNKWMKVGQIRDLLIYPIKGMPGFSVKEASLGRLGLKGTEET